MKRSVIASICIALASCGDDKNKMDDSPLNEFRDDFSMDELNLIDRIKAAQSESERDELISELERMPVKFHPFHSRWILINDAHSYSGWTESGYDPSLSEIPRDIQLLVAVGYGKSDIENGGFHQFFNNGTGVLAPEMIEWFERAGFPETAAVMKQAVAKFGAEFPRSQSERVELLEKIPGDTKAEWDPFHELDEPFYESVSRKDDLYDAAADKWLRETCGVLDLRSTIVAEQDGAEQPATAPQSKPEDSQNPKPESEGRSSL